MKSLYLLPIILGFSCAAFAGKCQKGNCGSGIPHFQSPFGNLAGSSASIEGGFSADGLNGLSDLGGKGGTLESSTFNGSTFNSGGARIQCRNGFLHVAGQPIFIGDNGEVLVKDRVTGQLILADSNTTSQVLAMYEDWARRVENGELPSDSKFAIAQRALSGNLSGGLSGGLASPFQEGQNNFGRLQTPPSQQNPIDPSITPNPGRSTPPVAQNTPPSNPPAAGSREPQNPLTSPGTHTDKPNVPAERPVEPGNTEEQKLNSSIDKKSLRVFSDDKGNLFFMEKDGSRQGIFAGNSTLASQMENTGFSGTSTQFHLSFEDSNFNSGKVEVDGEKMKLTCGANTKDFKELKGDEATKALETVRFRPLPSTREHALLAKTNSGEIIYVSRKKHNNTQEDYKLFLGEPGQLHEVPIKDYRILRDGGSTFIETDGGTFSFPIKGQSVFTPKEEGETPVKMDLIATSKLTPEELEHLLGKSLPQETKPQKLHTLCDQFDAP